MVAASVRLPHAASPTEATRAGSSSPITSITSLQTTFILNTIDTKMRPAAELSYCLKSARQEPTYLPLEGIAINT
jgi:hypothetical protein